MLPAPPISTPTPPTPTFSPLYEQIKTLLTQSLIAGEWAPGEAIPAEIELAKRYGVSQGTVRKAVDALAADNIVVRRQGKGTFVATHQEPTLQYKFLRLQPDQGEPTYPTSQFLLVRELEAEPYAAAALRVPAATPVIRVHRLLSFAGRPLLLDEVTLAADAVPGLTIESLRNFAGSFYNYLETRFGLRLVRAEERIKAVAAQAYASQVLAVPRSTPLLQVDRIAYTYDDRPVEFRRGLALTDGYSYLNALM